MTLPASGPITMSQVNTELQRSSTAAITMNEYWVRFMAQNGTVNYGTPITMDQLHGKSYVIAGNSGVITSGTSYTLPLTCGPTIKIIALGAGGGGGGGSGRTFQSGYYTGGGGGGAGGNVYTTVSVTPGATVYFTIGTGGGGGGARDGIYTSGSNGGGGGTTYVSVNGSYVATATGGGGGYVSPSGSAGGGGSWGTGSYALLTSSAGLNAGSGTTYGGQGARGYSINTSVGTALGSILTYGSYGTTYPQGTTGVYNTAGTIYGAGGSGGSCAQSDVYIPSYNINGISGTTGAVFIWWGY